MHRFTSTSIVSTAALLVVATTWAVSAQDHQEIGTNQTIYFPYPSGLMPADLESEIDRVNREVDQIFQETLARSRALSAPHLAGNPQIIRDSGTDLVETVGKLELFDKNLSVNRNQACSFCHMPYTGFTGPISSVNATVVSYPGSVHFRFSGRKPMAYTYSPYYPPLITMTHSRISTAAISGTYEPPDTSCRVPTPSRPSIRSSTLKSRASLTPPASYCACRRAHTDRFSRRYGEGNRSIFDGLLMPRKFVVRRRERKRSGRIPLRWLCLQKTAAAPTLPSIITRCRLLPTSVRGTSARSRPSSMRSLRATTS